MESATKDSKLVEEYRDLVEEGRQQFRKEIAALIPDSSPDGMALKKGNYTYPRQAINLNYRNVNLTLVIRNTPDYNT